MPIPWSEVEDTTEESLLSMEVFGSYLYAGSEEGGKIYRTLDGDTWAEVENTAEDRIQSLKVWDGYLYAGTNPSGLILRTSDGTTWSEAEDTAEGSVLAFEVFGSYLYAGTGSNGKILRTSDGTTWSVAETTTEFNINCFAVFGSYLYAGTSRDGKVYRSSDGTTWAEVHDTGLNDVRSLAVYDSYIYAGTGDFFSGGTIIRSANGTSWSTVESSPGDFVFALKELGGSLYAGTSPDGEILRTDNGTTWVVDEDLYSLGNAEFIFSLAVFNNNLYAGTGFDGKIFQGVGTEVNEGSLAVEIPPFECELGTTVFELPSVVAALEGIGGTAGTIDYASPSFVVAMEGTMDNLGSTGTGDVEIPSVTVDLTGIQTGAYFEWILVDTPGQTQTSDLEEYNGYYYSCSTSGKIHRSLIERGYGVNWTEVADITVAELKALASFKGKLYAGGYTANTGKVYSSITGTAWALEEEIVNGPIHVFLVFNEYLYAASDPEGKVLRSSDGTIWNEVANWAATAGNIHDLEEFDGYIYASTGPNGKIFRSANGTSWGEIADFTEDDVLNLATYQNYLYAGTDGGGKVYRTSDGSAWSLVFDSSENAIYSLEVNVVDGMLYAGTGPVYAKVYRSLNGLGWVETPTPPGGESTVLVLKSMGDFLFAGTGIGGSSKIIRGGYPYGELFGDLPSLLYEIIDTSPDPTLALEYQINVDFSLTGVTGTVGQMQVTIPPVSSTLLGDIRLEYATPIASASLTGITGTVGTMDYGIPALVFDGDATNLSSNMNFTLPSPMFAGIAANSSPGNIASSAKAKASLTGVTGTVGVLFCVCPSLTVEARGTPIITGVLYFECPPLFYSFKTSDSVPGTLVGYSICAENRAVTTYSNYDFIGLGNLDNMPIGAKSDGLYKLEGSNDDGSDIDAEVLTVLSSLGTNQQKRASDLYLTGDFPKDGMTGSFKVPNKVATIDSALVRSKVSNESYRAKVPRGIVFRRVSFGFKNVDGKDFKVDDLELRTSVTERKVK